jgi:hypothetical protein
MKTGVQVIEVVRPLVDAIRMFSRAHIIAHSGHGSLRRDTESFYIKLVDVDVSGAHIWKASLKACATSGVLA